MRKIAIIGICSILAACGGGGSSTSTSGTNSSTNTGTTNSTSSSTVSRAYSYSDTSANFATPATRNATITVNGASTTIAFTSPAVTLSTSDSFNNVNWTGNVGGVNQEKADGNFLRICSAATVAGTAVAVSEKMTQVAANTAASRSVLANRVFTLQDCTGTIKKTWTFNSDGSQFASSDNPTSFYPSAMLDQLFSATGFTDTSLTPSQTVRLKVYSYTYPTGTGYFLVNLNTDGTTVRVITATGQ